MKHNTYFQQFLILFVTLTNISCTSIYKTNELIEHAAITAQNLETPYLRIQRDFREKTQLVDELQQAKVDFLKFPFNQLADKYTGLKSHWLALEFQKQKLEGYYKNFNELANQQQMEISKKDKNYYIVADYKHFAKELERVAGDSIQNYVKLSKEFSSLTEKSDIFIITPKQFKLRVELVGRKLQGLIETRERKARRVERLIANVKSREPQRKLLEQILEIVDQLKVQQRNLSSLKNELNQNIPSNDRFLVGPHLNSHDYFVHFKENNNRLKGLVGRLYSLESQLANMD